MTEPPYSSIIAGWREWVSLPEVDVRWIKAKLDTGARTSSLHAFDLEEITLPDGRDGVRFGVHPWQDSEEDAVVVEWPVLDRREVRSSSGHSEERIFVLMDVELLGRTMPTEISLTNRDEMGFRMLIGREALRNGFLVTAGESFLGGRAPRRVRQQNRGR